MSTLERRYRHLLRAYPMDYRHDRGDEIVGTYLDLADPRRRWPSLADAADLVRGGLRQRLRAAGATDLAPGVRLAALLALTTAAFLAGFWALIEQYPPPAEAGVPVFGPFTSTGIVAWLAWLVVAVLVLVAPGRATRVAVAGAVLATVAVLLVSPVAGLPRPPLLVLVPQVALGVLALAVDNHLPLPARALPIVAAAGGGAFVAVAGNKLFWGSYRWTSEQVLPATGAVLLGVGLLLAVGLAMRRDWRGGWAVVVLLTPIGLLSVHVLAGAVDGLGGAPRPTYPTLVGAALTVGLLGPAVLPAAVAVRRRLGGTHGEPCPTCGARR
ncbi:hypothetical protein GCM10029963_65830 [Micromonospora andamanensis]|uniref:hypothetical protein n=1 Tax=Micromonospora andamanensis TaxID=1287068 RepID=UPI0019526EBE|nr:hypothetical protein [Micromonospora andamanensis]GIJ37530.1 hypothetical protein Vwe01_08550 [Micromonospora andamanensis]